MTYLEKSSRVTVHELAKRAGVSSRTVSRYLNENGYVSKKVRKQIGDLIDRVNYYPSAVARSLRRQKTMVVGLALYHTEYMHTDKEFFPALASGLADVLGRHGYSLQFLETNPQAAQYKQGLHYLDKVRGKSLDGLVIVDSLLPEQDILELQQYRMPFVVVNRLVEKLPGRCILGDFRHMGYRLARFLLDRGHRRIAYFGAGKGYTEAIHTMEGIHRAFGEYGVQLRDEDVNDDRRLMIEQMVRILSGEDAPTAAICGICAEKLAGLLRRGLKVCEKFEYVGRVADPEEIACKRFVYASRVVADELGKHAGQLLLDMLSGKDERDEPVLVDAGEFSRPTCDLESVLEKLHVQEERKKPGCKEVSTA